MQNMRHSFLGIVIICAVSIIFCLVSTFLLYETKEKEEKAEDDEDLGVYYLYVVLPNDTYASIARQYHVDEKMIREYNQDLNLDAGQILIIPYAPKNHSDKV